MVAEKHHQHGTEKQRIIEVRLFTALPKCSRAAQFVEELILLGYTPAKAKTEVEQSVDRIVLAGSADQSQALFSTVNPVASSHFNFSVQEPSGVVCVIAPEESPLLGLISVVIPAILQWKHQLS